MLLPPGLVAETTYMRTPGRAMDLDFSAPPPRPTRAVLQTLLPDLRTAPRLLPRARCGRHGCGGVGWCDGSTGAPRCMCAASMMGPDGLQRFQKRPRRLHRPSADGDGEGGSCGASAEQSDARHPRDISRRALRSGERSRARAWAGGAPPAADRAFPVDPDRVGPDRWRQSIEHATAMSACPNGCNGRGRGGRCEYGFCHCEVGYWGLDCGLSAARWAATRSAAPSREVGRPLPRVHVYRSVPNLVP